MSSKSQEDALEALAASRWRVAAVLTVATLVAYFGFILLVAFNKPLMGHQIAPGLSVGILLGAVVIVTAWALTGIYMIWANGKYDRALSQLRR
ncbi:DUF485 domain-containing protein [Myxococcus sp. CA051A]|uniref:DUF485 domain-containing protein n=1 Tax=Myxococcus llanfairpwllgwyngyllgogerychwyrndrobwllllantysiliogogogochensis TaxID=2590453 RepID=A0A540X8R5_9BACT|nr:MULTISPECIES: DUF485 domain-containing protein [Myxococcus]NTX00477.1 DUF485 domain-containing protein [Myxococcus sp. CA040A]NTX17836.1 DUF485 domain-containing protein [Myxococcus sp. CA056]NTX33835.1 DUF485 domain-containing protein [Myxococcus sp. CA033]NTX49790.1 DUF485 domain-containing protein [Myxococcus sp. CA039A]NTX59058.1 DUF485 domain-containing protein [Myxococcus sp. CA051A]